MIHHLHLELQLLLIYYPTDRLQYSLPQSFMWI
jgi:hypothetical protein